MVEEFYHTFINLGQSASGVFGAEPTDSNPKPYLRILPRHVCLAIARHNQNGLTGFCRLPTDSRLIDPDYRSKALKDVAQRCACLEIPEHFDHIFGIHKFITREHD